MFGQKEKTSSEVAAISSAQVIFPDRKTADETIEALKKRIEELEKKVENLKTQTT